MRFVHHGLILAKCMHVPHFRALVTACAGGPDTKFAPEGFYKNSSWVLCPPATVCSSPGQAVQVNKPYKLAVRGADLQ